MKLPVISEATKARVLKQIMGYKNLEIYCQQEDDKLHKENSNLARVLATLREGYKDQDWVWLALTYAYGVYEMFKIELHGNMPLVSANVIEPMRIDFSTDNKAFMDKLELRLKKENPEVLELALNLITQFLGTIHQNKHAMTQMLMLFGLFVFRLLESKLEADEMDSSLL
jgi:hypothetical protein